MFKVTALVSVFNSKKFLKYKILNLLKQEVQAQVILIDCTNGDDLKTVGNLIDTSQFIKVIYSERIPIWEAINVGVKLAKTPYIVQSNTDDLLHPRAFQKQIEKLDAGYDISYFDFAYVHDFQKDWSTALNKSYEVYKVPSKYTVDRGLGAFPMWRKSLHDKYGLFDENLEIYGDSLFWSKLAKDDHIKWGPIGETLGVYAIRADNLEKNLKFQKHDHDILYGRGK